MSISPFRIEEAILRSIALVPGERWVQCYLGDLRNRIAEVDAQVANESTTLIIDALVSLGVQEHLELSKIEAGQRSTFHFQRKRDGEYLNQFFGVNPFDLRLTHDGRKRLLQSPKDPTHTADFPTSLVDIRKELDYWAKRQTEGAPGSTFHAQVTDRLTHLRNLEQRVMSQAAPPTTASGQTKICIGAFGNKYSLGSIIGNGGAGVVYEARTEENSPCAVKVLTTQQSSKVKRFKNEIAYCFRNQHKNIISVWDFGQTDGKTFYVMPLYSGTLRKLILTGVEPEKILDIFSQVLDGVEAAHQSGVFHRDIKPENVLFDTPTSTLIVADFGIAKFKEEELQTAIETSAHEKLANFQYSAPEQRVRGRNVDQRADIYALGLILNEMFTGDVLQGMGFKRIGSVAPRYSYLDPVIDSMVQQIPENRPESISDIRRLLGLSPLRATMKADASNTPAHASVLSSEEREKIFEEADVDFAITQGMQQTFMVSFGNKSDSSIVIKKLKISYNGIKILEAPPRDKKPWQLEPNRSQEFSWEANPDPVTSLMQIQGEWNKPFNLNLEIFVQIEILGRIKTFENRRIFCQVEPSMRRIWQRL